MPIRSHSLSLPPATAPRRRRPDRPSLLRWATLALMATAILACSTRRADAIDLSSLPAYRNYESGRFSSTDGSGGNLDMRPVPSGESLVLAEIEGPGCVTHIWFTYLYPGHGALRKLVLRAWFDDSETPCIEAPLGDFFGLGNAIPYTYASEALSVGTHRGLNCFFRMPFARKARFTITNDGPQPCRALYYYIDYEKYEKPRTDLAYFHAQYRQATPCVKGEPYVILDAKGRGHFLGCNLSIEQGEDSWWGEGDDLFFIDGEEKPSIKGTGSEDYFSGAWCYQNEFAFPLIGMPFRGRHLPDGTLDRYSPHLNPLDKEQVKEWSWPQAWRKGDLWNVYRYHLESPVAFRKSLTMAIEHGWIDNERLDNYSSVAYWYQDLPHGPQPPLPSWKDRLPVFLRPVERADGVFEAEELADDSTPTGGYAFGTGSNFWGKGTYSRDGFLEWLPKTAGDTLTIPVPVAEDGRYEVSIKTISTGSGGIFDIAVNGETVKTGLDLYVDSPFPGIEARDMGTRPLKKGTMKLSFTYKGANEKAKEPRLTLDTIQRRSETAPEKSETESGKTDR